MQTVDEEQSKARMVDLEKDEDSEMVVIYSLGVDSRKHHHINIFNLYNLRIIDNTHLCLNNFLGIVRPMMPRTKNQRQICGKFNGTARKCRQRFNYTFRYIHWNKIIFL